MSPRSPSPLRPAAGADVASEPAPRGAIDRAYRGALRWLPSGELTGLEDDATELFRDLRRAAPHRLGRWRVILGCFATALQAVLVTRIEHWRRARRRLPLWEKLLMSWHDLRYAFRSFRRSPGFAVTVILLVALGVGATSSVFSVVDGVLLRRLPYPQAERLIYFSRGAHSVPRLTDWRQQLTAFDALVAGDTRSVAVTGDGDPVSVKGAWVTRGFLQLFGASALEGRLLLDEDGRQGRPVAVLGYAFWQQRFGSDPEVLGQNVLVDGKPLEIVGVLSPHFRAPEAMVGGKPTAIWQPFPEEEELYQFRGMHILQVVGRLAPGRSLEQAQAEIDAVAGRLAKEFPEFEANREGEPRLTPLVPLQVATVGEVGKALAVFLTAVAMLLLIACTNVASLFLARGTVRERELALRSALGASRGRIVRQLLGESVALSVVGGLGGVLIAMAGVRGFHLLEPGAMPRAAEVAVDWRVLLFAVAVATLTGVAFGTAPALRAARASVGAALRVGAGGGRSQQRLRTSLVVVEVALALVLAVGAGLLFHSFLRLRSVELGFDADELTVMRLQLPGGFQDKTQEALRPQWVADLLGSIEALPGVSGAAASWIMPFDETGGSRCCWRSTATRPEIAGDEGIAPTIHAVTPSYFQVLGVPLLAGRVLTADEPASPLPSVLTRTFAQHLYGDQPAVGKTLKIRGDELLVVGVVDDVRQWGQDAEQGDQMYVPYSIKGGVIPILSVAVRSTLPTDRLADSLRRAVWARDASQPVLEIRSMAEKVSQAVATPRFQMLLFGCFALVSLVLAAAGVYGALLYSVGQRRREMGIRLAVGAARTDLLGLVVRQGALMALAGIALGTTAALLLGRTIESFLFDVRPADPWTLGSVVAVLLLAALAACYVPARRAARTDPVETLRAE